MSGMVEGWAQYAGADSRNESSTDRVLASIAVDQGVTLVA
jgi:hypothetical protein